MNHVSHRKFQTLQRYRARSRTVAAAESLRTTVATRKSHISHLLRCLSTRTHRTNPVEGSL